MVGSVYTALREAVLNKMQIVCVYHGLPREICPHAIGWKHGREKILAYQFAGRSSKGLPPDGEWRCMFGDEISAVNVRPGPWRTGSRHSRPQTCVDEIDAEVEF